MFGQQHVVDYFYYFVYRLKKIEIQVPNIPPGPQVRMNLGSNPFYSMQQPNQMLQTQQMVEFAELTAISILVRMMAARTSAEWSSERERIVRTAADRQQSKSDLHPN